MYITDIGVNTVLSILCTSVGANLEYRITNGVDSITVAELEIDDVVKVRTVYNTEYKVFNIHTEHYDSSLAETL